MAENARGTVKLFVDGVREPVETYNFVKEDTIEDDGDGQLTFDMADGRTVATTLQYIAVYPTPTED